MRECKAKRAWRKQVEGNVAPLSWSHLIACQTAIGVLPTAATNISKQTIIKMVPYIGHLLNSERRITKRKCLEGMERVRWGRAWQSYPVATAAGSVGQQWYPQVQSCEMYCVFRFSE